MVLSKHSSQLLRPHHQKIVKYITHHGIYQWLTMLSQIRAAEIKSKAKLINYVFHYLGDIEIQKFCCLAGDSASTTPIAGQFLFFFTAWLYFLLKF